MITLSIIFFTLAAICNAVMDVISFHYYDSIFNSNAYDKYWWDPSISWMNKYPGMNFNKPVKKICFGLFDKPFTDAWHTFKSLMIVFICMSFSCLLGTSIKLNIIEMILVFFLYGLLWNVTFNIYYNHIFKK